MSDLVFKPWSQLNGLRKLVLTGPIPTSMRDRLTQHVPNGPFPSEVTDVLTCYRSLAKGKLAQGDYLAARWFAMMFDHY